jgi:hypothetical protein
MKTIDIQHLDGAVADSHEARLFQFVQGPVGNLARQAAEARNFLL